MAQELAQAPLSCRQDECFFDMGVSSRYALFNTADDATIPVLQEGQGRRSTRHQRNAKKPSLCLKQVFSEGRAQGQLEDEMQNARSRGEVRDCAVEFVDPGANLDEGVTLESVWVQAKTSFGNSSGLFAVQLGLSCVDDDTSAGRSEVTRRLFTRVKPMFISKGPGDAERHWAARVVFQVGCSDPLFAVIPDHRRPIEEDEARTSVQEVCAGKLPIDADILAEVRSTGSLQLSFHLEVRDAGAPVSEEKFKGGCGCC